MTVAAWLESPEGEEWRRLFIRPVGDDEEPSFAQILPLDSFGTGASPPQRGPADARHDPCGRPSESGARPGERTSPRRAPHTQQPVKQHQL